MEYKTGIYTCQVFVLLSFCHRLICPCDDSSTNWSISFFLKGVLSHFLFWFFFVVTVCLFGWVCFFGFFCKKGMVMWSWVSSQMKTRQHAFDLFSSVTQMLSTLHLGYSEHPLLALINMAFFFCCLWRKTKALECSSSLSKVICHGTVLFLGCNLRVNAEGVKTWCFIFAF